MRNLLLSISIVLFFTSCKSFTGQYDSNQDLTLVHTTVFGNKKKIVIPADLYTAKLGFSSKNKLKINLKSAGKSPISVKIQVPENTELPTNGKISILASQSGQFYDLKGRVSTSYTRSDSVRGTEGCSYYEDQWICNERCDRHGNCRNICDYEEVAVPGTRDVIWHDATTSSTVGLSFIKPGQKNVRARLTGSHTSTDRVYEHEGECL
jgi:hypothetical protein